jgi:hypothetical protein
MWLAQGQGQVQMLLRKGLEGLVSKKWWNGGWIVSFVLF